MVQVSIFQIDSSSAFHLRRYQHEKWKVHSRVENSQQPLTGQKNTNKALLHRYHFSEKSLCTNHRYTYLCRYGNDF